MGNTSSHPHDATSPGHATTTSASTGSKQTDKHRRSAPSSSKNKNHSHHNNKQKASSGANSGSSGGAEDPITARASKVVGDFQAGIANGIRKLEEQDHPAAALLDSMCGPYLDPTHKGGMTMRSSYSEEYVSEEDDSRTVSEEETTVTTDYHATSHRRRNKGKSTALREDETTVDSRSYASEYDASTLPDTTQPPPHRNHKHSRMAGSSSSSHHKSSSAAAAQQRGREESSYDTEDDQDTYTASRVTTTTSADETEAETAASASVMVAKPLSAAALLLSKQPLASSFAKRCYFTKAGIGGHTQHYEGLTLTGNVILMLAAAMKLKGCPTICDEDLRRVEQTYPNQFSRLPDELLLSSGWRRISKYCHFSNKPIPDGIPFFRKFLFICLFLLIRNIQSCLTDDLLYVFLLAYI
jgi:hypothetical protein